LRAARLSGFFTVIHSPVHEDSVGTQLTTLQSLVEEKDVDGWLITAAAPEELVIRKAAQARALIRSSFWRQFSEHVEEALLSQAPARELRDAQAFDPEHVHTEAGGAARRTSRTNKSTTLPAASERAATASR